jgi:hypothetical protein
MPGDLLDLNLAYQQLMVILEAIRAQQQPF